MEERLIAAMKIHKNGVIKVLKKMVQKWMDGVNYGGGVWWAALVLLPLVMWPGAAVPFEIPRVLVVQVVGWLVSLGVFLWLLRGGKANSLEKGLMVAVLVWLVWLVVTAVLGSDVGRSWWGNYYRRDGLMSLLGLYGLAVATGLSWRKEWWRWLQLGMVLGMGVVSLVAVAEAITGGWGIMTPWDGAVGATFGQPNFLAGYLLVVMPFGIDIVVRSRGLLRWWAVAAVIVGAVAMILTKSVVGVVGLGLLVLVWWLTGRWSGRRLMVMLVGLWLVMLVGQAGMISRMDKYAPDSRLRMTTKLLMAWEKKPVLGWGWANVDKAFEAVVWPLPYLHDVYVDKAHGQMLEMLVSSGVVGLVLYGWVVMKLGWNLVREEDVERYKSKEVKKYRNLGDEWGRVLVVVWWMYLFHSQTNVMSVAEEVVFWVVMGLGMVEKSVERSVKLCKRD